VGKTTVAWEIWSQLCDTGITAAYLDIDQLGMSVPAPDDDSDRHRVKAENLAAIVPIYRAAGARCVVVSGVVDAEKARSYADQVPGATVALCQLRLDHDELRTRLVGRGWSAAMVDQAMDEAAELDHSAIADIRIDTTGLPVADVVRLVQEQTSQWPLPPEQNPSLIDLPSPATAGLILWLCGATGVGKSTIGWQVFMQIRRAGMHVAFIDLEQIGFLKPAPAGDPCNHRLKARNLTAMWQTFQADGAERLIVVGGVNDHEHVRAYTKALPKTTLTLVRLHAGQEQLAERIMRRGDGEGWRIPGDPLKGQDTAVLQQIADVAASDAEWLASNRIGDMCIDTDERTVEEVTQDLLQQIGH
jgi:adenylylsulfate kinase-like enzyme